MSIQQKLSALLALKGWTQARVAERLGVSQSTVNRWKQGTAPEGDHRDALAELYAEVYGLSTDDKMMRVRGYVGPDQIVHILDRADQGWIERPPPVGFSERSADETIAITVRGDGLRPHFEDRWTLFFSVRCDPSEVVGELVIAHTAEGQMVLSRVRRSEQEGLWNLTYPGKPDVLNAEIESASPIDWIKPYTWYSPF